MEKRFPACLSILVKRRTKKMDAKVGLEEDGGKQQHKFESAAFMENVNLRTFSTIMICSL